MVKGVAIGGDEAQGVVVGILAVALSKIELVGLNGEESMRVEDELMGQCGPGPPKWSMVNDTSRIPPWVREWR
jgi:hypothetical protein